MHRPDSTILKAAAALMAMACLMAAPAAAALIDLTPAIGQTNSVDSVSLAELQADPDACIVVGDKIFSGFSYSAIGDMPPPEDVLVLGFRDLDDNWGISFHAAFIDLPGGGASDALIRFMVEVDPDFAGVGFRISDAHLFVNAGLGDESFVGVDETFLEKPNEGLSAFATTLGPLPGTTQLSDSVIFATPVVKLTVSKDITLIAANTGNVPARATIIDQSFSQIPEPTTLLLAGMSGMAVVAASRRRR